MAREADQFETQPDGCKSANHAQSSVGERDEHLPAAKQIDALITKRRKRRKPAEQTGKQKQPRLRGEPIAMLDQRGECADQQAPDNVDRKGAEGEAPRSGLVQNHSAEPVANDRPNESAEADNQRLF